MCCDYAVSVICSKARLSGGLAVWLSSCPPQLNGAFLHVAASDPGRIPHPTCLQVSDAGNDADAQVVAADMQQFFPMYHGALDLGLASLAPALPQHAALYDADSNRLLVTDFGKATVQVVYLDDEEKEGSQPRRGGYLPSHMPSCTTHHAAIESFSAWPLGPIADGHSCIARWRG